MLSLSLARPRVHAAHADFLDLLADVREIRSRRGARAANQRLLDGVGLVLRSERDEAFYSAALDYHLGQLCTALGIYEDAAAYFERSQTLPHDGEPLVYSEQVAVSLELRERQVAALHIPSILISCMPRAASASLTQTLSATLGIPVLRPSTGYYPFSILVPRWLRLFMSGGAVSHDHFGPSEFNLRTLRRAEVKSLFVLGRDPRAAAWSLHTFSGRRHVLKLSGMIPEDEFLSGTGEYADWLDRWCAVAEAGEFELRWIRSRDFMRDPAGTIRSILSYFPDVPEHEPAIVKANMVTGDDDAWRSHISADYASRCWEIIPPRVRELLSLEP